MQKFIFLSIFLISALITLGQQKEATISYNEEEYDFGQIKEEDGPVTHKFEFTNTGSLPLVIFDVQATCGCTTPRWSKEPILAGGKGFIEVTYNPMRRPGAFNKSVTIKSNASEELTFIRIKGEVIPKPKTLEDDYPFISGGLRFKSNHFSFGEVYYNQEKILEFPLVNVSDSTIKVTVSKGPNYLTISCIPEVLKPGDIANLVIAYNAQKAGKWDFNSDRISILQNGYNVDNNTFTISATIVEDFSNLTPEELDNAPVISFDNQVYDFGSIPQHGKAEHEFVFTNAGKKNLEIRQVKATCGCTVVQPKENVIPSGQSSSIKAVFSAGTRKGNQNKTITVISNDPKNPRVTLKMTGSVDPVPGQ